MKGVKAMAKNDTNRIEEQTDSKNYVFKITELYKDDENENASLDRVTIRKARSCSSAHAG